MSDTGLPASTVKLQAGDFRSRESFSLSASYSIRMRWIPVLLFMAIAQFCAAQVFDIRSFDVNVDVQPSGALKVTENIVAHFYEEHHGIYRAIDTDLDNGKGSTRSIYISDIDTGSDQNKVSRKDGQLNIRIGDSSSMISPGEDHLYVIHYTVKNAINWFDEESSWHPYSEVYWNAIGPGWQDAIARANVTVTFPKVAAATDVRARVFAGRYGITDSATVHKAGDTVDGQLIGSKVELTDSTLKISRLEPLESGEALTFVLDLPYAAIHKPTAAEQLQMFLLSNLGFTLPIFALIIGWLGYMKYGKDPDGGPMVVQFDPPENLSGSEAGAFLDERVDQRDLTAGLVTLGVKGYLKIHAAEEGAVFKHKKISIELTGKAKAGDLGPFESKLLEYMEPKAPLLDESDLRDVISPNITSLQSLLYTTLVQRNYYRSSPETARIVFGLVMFLILGAIGLILIAISPLHNPLPTIIGAVLSLPLLIIFSKLAPCRTESGSKTWAKLRGFEDFIRRARQPELEWLAKVHPDQALFEKYLPHAMAFGLATEWSSAFNGIMLQSPSWYDSGPYYGGFNPIFFTNDLNSVTTAAAASAFTPPRSSGSSGGSSGFSSGGGFSGGGFGGGGGGSW